MAAPHEIRGRGAGVATAILDAGPIDRLVTIGGAAAFDTGRRLAGVSSAAAAALVLGVAGKRMGVSFAERHRPTAPFDGR